MKKFLSMILGVVAITLGSLVAFPAVDGASAAPAGAATGLKATAVSCNGSLASYRLTWTPTGKGPQRVDLSATNNGFANNFSSGNLDVNATVVDLTSLKVSTTYYVRIVTTTAGGALASDTLAFTANCQVSPAFSVPTQLHSRQIGKGLIHFQWAAGQGNKHFCLDTATNATDLLNLKGTWRNHGCGTTASSVDVSSLPCGAVVYWRVFAWGTGSGHSQVAVASTQPCVIGKPTNLDADPTGHAGMVLSWTPGAENRWFCVDVARSAGDLASLSGSWQNYGCWMTGNAITLSNLECGETYYWNVYAWNQYTNTRSANASFEVLNCNKIVLAPIEDLEVIKDGSRYYAKVVAGLPNGCHKAAEVEVDRSGRTFEITVTYEVYPGNCQYFVGHYSLTVDLGRLDDGRTYKVIVNDDESVTFEAS